MGEKYKILFVMDSLHCAGGEKSLTTLLNLLDYDRYSVDLQLFGYGGEFEKLLPQQVNLLEPMDYTKFSGLSLKKAILKSINPSNIKMLAARIEYSRNIRKANYTHAGKARLFWQATSNVFPVVNTEYDVAISYAQGVPTFYVAEKIKAKKKFAWVNVSYRLEEVDREFQRNIYKRYDKISAVSESTKEILLESFPEFIDKMVVIKDINDAKFINNMAEIGPSYNDKFDGIRLLTIGRLAPQKGYDIALEACRLLKEKEINFRWYVLGKGPLEGDIKQTINQYELTENFKLLGVSPNPYSYIKDCDLYVQTSILEGFGIAIAEARMLNKPVVTTRFDAVFTQMVHRKNGLVVDMNGQAVCDGIVELLNNDKLKEEIIEYLKKEKKGNTEEIDKFYELIG